MATSVMAVKSTPKALRLMEEAKEEKGEELTKLEVIKAAAPVYIPAILTGVTTIACIFGANVLNKRHQASLMSAYALLDSSYKDYKAKVEELYGEDADTNIRTAIAKDNYEEDAYDLEDDKVLFYEEYSRQYFEASMDKVLKAEYLINRDLQYHGYAFLNEWFEHLGLPKTDYGDILGWSSSFIWECQWYSWIEFHHRKVELEDGMECYILEVLTEPIPDFEEH